MHSVADKNPFSKALKGGANSYGIGNRVAYGSAVVCICFLDSHLVNASGQILAIGFITYLVWVLCSGIGLITGVAVYWDLEFIYLLRWNKDRNGQNFFRDFGEFKMNPERQIYLDAINKINKYFNNYISNDDGETKFKITNIQDNISSIIDIYQYRK